MRIVKGLLLYASLTISSCTMDDRHLSMHLNELALNANNPENSIELLDSAISLDPNNKLLYSNRAYFYYELEKWEASFSDCLKSLKRDSLQSDMWGLMGLINYNTGEYEESVKHLKKAILIEDKNPEYYYYSGLSYYMIDEFNSTVVNVENALELDPDSSNIEAIEILVGAKLLIGDSVGIKQVLDFLEKKRSGSASFYVLKANYLIKLKRYRDALKELDKAIAIKENHAGIFYMRASIYTYMNDLKGACAEWAKAGSLGNTEAKEFFKNHCE